MSQAALCKAVRDKLQATFSLDENSCSVCYDGQPQNPSCGEMYIAVHPMGWNGISGDFDLHEEVQVGVTLTMRAAFAPKDRRGIAVWLTEDDGMEARLRQIIAAIHQSQTVRAAANTYIPGTDLDKFITALWFLNVSPPVARDYDWFSAAAPQTQVQTDACGVSQTITFGKAQRCQAIADMD